MKPTYLLILDTEGTLSWEHTPSLISISRISQANMFGLRILYKVIDSITSEVATLGLEPPIRPGLIEPVELNLKIILFFFIYLNWWIKNKIK